MTNVSSKQDFDLLAMRARIIILSSLAGVCPTGTLHYCYSADGCFTASHPLRLRHLSASPSPATVSLSREDLRSLSFSRP